MLLLSIFAVLGVVDDAELSGMSYLHATGSTF